MAQKVGEIYYEVTADTAGLVAAQKDVDKSVDKMEAAFTAVTSAVLELSSNIKLLVDATKVQSRASTEAATANDKLATSTKGAANAADAAAKAAGQNATATKKQTDAAKDLAKAEDDAAAATKKRKSEQGAGAKAPALAPAPAPAPAQPLKPTNSGGMSDKALAAAQRNIPAQVTDIVTGLSTGQSPLTVLMQQGGQLKDMFGGVLPAVRALGSYVAGLVTPFTAAAAAVGLLIVGFVKGRQESEEFRKSLTLTGNQAGETVDRLNAMAQRLDGSMEGVTQGSAAEALNEFVAAGIRGGDALERITGAALRLEQAGGPAVADTAKAFRELGKDPLNASLKLNDSVNFLTTSVYQQIKALTDQGKTVEAAKVAQEAYAASILARTPQIIDNLNIFQRSWKAVSNSAREAWDSILNIGRDDPQALEKKLAKAQAQLDKIRNYNGGAFAYGKADRDKDAAALQVQVDAMKEQLALQEKSRTHQKDAANEQARNAEKVAALGEFDRRGERFQDRQSQMKKEIDQAKSLGLAAGLNEKQIGDRIAEIRKSYGVGQKADEAQAYYQNLVAANATAIEQINAEEKAALADNHKRMAEDSANARTYAQGRVEIQKKYARERALVEEKTTQELADFNIATTTDQEEQINMVEVEAYRRSTALAKLGVITYTQAEQQKAQASFQAAQQRAQIEERLAQTSAENVIASTIEEMTRIDLIRQENIRRAEAQYKQGAITYAQAEADKTRAAIDAQNAIRQQVMSVNPLAALTQEYQQKLAIVQFYEDQMAKAGFDGAMFVEQKRAELATQFQQQRMALAEAEFANQGLANKTLIDGLNSLESTATSSITGLITGTMSAADAMRGLANTVLNEAVGALVQIGVQYIKNALIGQAAEKAMMATKAANAALYTTAITAQVGATTALAAQNAFMATAAIPIVGPALAPGAAAAAAAGAAALGAPAIAAAPVAGARMYGGGVEAGSLYRVGEKGPEMFTASNGNQYMLPGQRGQVASNDELGNGKVNLQVVVNNNHPTAEVTAQVDETGRIVQIAVSEVASQIAGNTGPVWSAMRGSTNVQGRM